MDADILRRDVAFLDAMARAVVDASRVPPGAAVAGSRPNITGATLIKPGGRDAYPAFWIRDLAMSLESGLIAAADLEHALTLTLQCQMDHETTTATGSLIPPGAIPDHILFDGEPIFFPGTYDPQAQGGVWGYLPALDDAFYAIEMAWHCAFRCGHDGILTRRLRGRAVWERLDMAFACPPEDPATHCVQCTEDHRGASFGFTDKVVHTGRLLVASLLKATAAVRLAQIHAHLGDACRARRYGGIAEALREAIPAVFQLDSGFLRASTGLSGQADVWGTAYAIAADHLRGEARRWAATALAKAFAEGTIAWQGAIRQVPTDADFSAGSIWERTISPTPMNHYQNGAYWSTPTGWVCCALREVDEAAAASLFHDLVESLRREDFRQGGDGGAPWECMHPHGAYRGNAVYMTSVTCPLAEARQWFAAGGPHEHGRRAATRHDPL